MARKSKKSVSTGETVPGPSTNPATNLLMADVVMRMGTSVLRTVVEKRFLKGRYGQDTARAIVDNRSFKKTIASVVVAKVATRSVPGAIIIGGGMMVKTLFDRSQKRRKSTKSGDQVLLEQAKDN